MAATPSSRVVVRKSVIQWFAGNKLSGGFIYGFFSSALAVALAVPGLLKLPGVVQLSSQGYFVSILTFLSITTLILSALLAVTTIKLSTAPKLLTEEDMTGLSKQFGKLLHRQIKFESAVAKCMSHLYSTIDSGGIGIVPDNVWNSLHNDMLAQYDTMLATICHTAAYVISTKHGDKQNSVSVNIKTIRYTKTEKPEAVYVVDKRSSDSDTSREQADDHLKTTEFRVDQNMIYSSFFGEHNECVINGVSVIDDMDDYIQTRNKINEERIQNNLHPYKEPSDFILQFYQSCIAAPIVGPGDMLELENAPGALGGASMSLHQDLRLVGILCIDSPKKAYFDRLYDVEIMRQLSLHAFSAIRSVYGVGKLRNDILKKIGSNVARARES